MSWSIEIASESYLASLPGDGKEVSESISCWSTTLCLLSVAKKTLVSWFGDLEARDGAGISSEPLQNTLLGRQIARDTIELCVINLET
jgi:hypothetical protein